MQALTARLWQEQDRHPGDRFRLFETVAEFTGQVPVLYPGSFVDVSPSFVLRSVTYVDTDDRAARFFDDATGVNEIIASHRPNLLGEWRFLHADYRGPIGLADRSFGLLVSLFAGFVSEHCSRYLRPGGWLLVNSSHGDAAMASIDPDYRLAAVVTARSGTYALTQRNLDGYLIPKRPTDVTAELIHARGRGIGYTKSPFAYLFQRRDD